MIEAQLGSEAARQVFAMSLEALDLMRARIERFGIECDWRDGYLGVATTLRKARALHDEVDLLAARYDHPLRWIEPRDLPQWIASPRYVAAAHDPRSGHLHPLKYTLGLALAGPPWAYASTKAAPPPPSRGRETPSCSRRPLARACGRAMPCWRATPT